MSRAKKSSQSGNIASDKNADFLDDDLDYAPTRLDDSDVELLTGFRSDSLSGVVRCSRGESSYSDFN